MNTLLPGLRVSEGHVNQSSETTKSRNHQNVNAARQLLQFSDGRSHSLVAAKYYIVIDIISNMWRGQELPLWEVSVS